MSKLSKKLILSVLTLVLTVVALGATTFAWFTLGNEATVGQVGGTITAGEGLEIRIAQGQEGYMDGENVTDITGFESWYTNLPSSKLVEFLEIKYHENHNRIDLKGLTTEDGVTLYGMNTTPAAGNSGAYIEYALEVRSQTPGFLYVSSAKLEGAPVSWVADTNYSVVDGIDAVADQTTVVVSAADAARLSVEGNTNHVFAFQNQAGAATAEANSGSDNHTITVGNTITGKHNDGNYVAPSKFGAHDYFFMKSGGSDMTTLVAPLGEAFTLVSGGLVAIPDDDNNVKLVDTYIPLSEEDRNEDSTHAKAIAELKHAFVPASEGATHKEVPGNPGQFIEADGSEATHKLDTEGYAYATITVRIWIEGWDNEAYNAIFTAPLFASLAVVKKD